MCACDNEHIYIGRCDMCGRRIYTDEVAEIYHLPDGRIMCDECKSLVRSEDTYDVARRQEQQIKEEIAIKRAEKWEN